jgi:hypothetical protein
MHLNYSDIVAFNTLMGLTLTQAVKLDDERIEFIAATGETFTMAHSQDCCETVEIDDIVGDLADLIGSPIVRAEERTSDENPKDPSDVTYGSFTWTFYELATVKGAVTIKWYGTSNGYYSESVDLYRKALEG